MRKNILALFIILLLLAFTVGCSPDEQSAESDGKATEQLQSNTVENVGEGNVSDEEAVTSDMESDTTDGDGWISGFYK